MVFVASVGAICAGVSVTRAFPATTTYLPVSSAWARARAASTPAWSTCGATSPIGRSTSWRVLSVSMACRSCSAWSRSRPRPAWGTTSVTVVPSKRRSPSTRPDRTAFVPAVEETLEARVVVVHDEVDDVGPEPAQDGVGHESERVRVAARVPGGLGSSRRCRPSTRSGSDRRRRSADRRARGMGVCSSWSLNWSSAARDVGFLLARDVHAVEAHAREHGTGVPDVLGDGGGDDQRRDSEHDATGEQEHPSAARANERCCLGHRRQASEAGRMGGCAKTFVFGSRSSGASDDDIDRAEAEGWLPLLAFDRMLLPGRPKYDLRALAAAAAHRRGRCARPLAGGRLPRRSPGRRGVHRPRRRRGAAGVRRSPASSTSPTGRCSNRCA